MKTTLKEYQAKVELRKSLKNQKEDLRDGGDWDLYASTEAQLEELQKEYFDKLPTVNVSFYIGSRSYYQEVIKIGKAYFDHGRKMTRSNGYSCIEEIPVITEQMQKDMIADSYYY